MPHKLQLPLPAPMLVALLLLLTGCASTPQTLPPVAPPAIPPLPSEARQPPPPEVCLPTCSQGLMRLREQLLNTPTLRE
jgi:hypothetical protein